MAARPNFLFLITDQQRADHLGCAGHPVLRTPHLDALAASGIHCQRAYVASPLCMPSRSTLYTGLTPRGHGVRTNGIDLDPGIPTFTEALRRSGYRTHSVGKIHLRVYGLPTGASEADVDPADFPEARDLWRSGRITDLPSPYYGLETADFTGGHGGGIYGHYLQWLRTEHPGAERLLHPSAGQPPRTGAEQAWTMALPAELHYNTWCADRTIAFLESAAADAGNEHPFVAWCSFPDPHHPYCPPRPWGSAYAPDDMPSPARRVGELDELAPHFRQAYAEGLRTSGRLAPTNIPDDELREITALTYGMVSFVDEQVGRVMAAVDRLGLRDNTVVVFLSDHGDMLGDHWLLNKGPFHFDGILRVPLIWSWPGRFPAGVQSDALVSLLDVAPTVLDLAGVPVPEGTVPPVPEAPAMLPPWPGQVLTPLLEGRATSVQPAVVVENDEDYLGLRLRTLVTNRHQLTVYPGQPYGELFDTQQDPGQLHNLWGQPHCAGLRRDLQALLLDRLVLTDNRLPRRLAHA